MNSIHKNSALTSFSHISREGHLYPPPPIKINFSMDEVHNPISLKHSTVQTLDHRLGLKSKFWIEISAKRNFKANTDEITFHVSIWMPSPWTMSMLIRRTIICSTGDNTPWVQMISLFTKPLNRIIYQLINQL